MRWPKCPGLLSACTLLRVQQLAWLLEFLNKGPCRLLVHACLLPVADSCPRGQRLRTQVMPAHLPLRKREEFLVCSHRPLAGASGFFPGRHCLNGTWTFPFLPLLMHTSLSLKISPAGEHNKNPFLSAFWGPEVRGQDVTGPCRFRIPSKLFSALSHGHHQSLH